VTGISFVDDSGLAKLNDGIKKVIADGTWKKVHQQFEADEAVPASFAGGQ
jgi:polar amino acid transport system substrate-binding protein